MNKPQSITTLGETPDEERHRRMVRYAIAMGIRLVCILLCFVVQGWWLILPAAGAIVLPYIAVVLANAVTRAPSSPTSSLVRELPVAGQDDDRA